MVKAVDCQLRGPGLAPPAVDNWAISFSPICLSFSGEILST